VARYRRRDGDAIRRREGAAMMRITIVVLALLLTARNDEGSPAVLAPISHWKIAYRPNIPNQNGVHYVYKVAPAIGVGQGKLRSNGRHRDRPRAAVSATAGGYAYGAGAV
jgi:hypothetical protein